MVREGVTNVVRHSRGESVPITLDATGIEIVDDGIWLHRVRPAKSRRLTRAAVSPDSPNEPTRWAVGWSLGLSTASATGFRLRVEVPAERCRMAA